MTSAPTYDLSPTAQLQIAQIGSDDRFTEAARKAKINTILTACSRCAENPGLWGKGRVEGTHERYVKPFWIVYREREYGIEVAAIWHEKESRENPPE
jgi:plasmid stabilization system protein ParE